MCFISPTVPGTSDRSNILRWVFCTSCSSPGITLRPGALLDLDSSRHGAAVVQGRQEGETYFSPRRDIEVGTHRLERLAQQLDGEASATVIRSAQPGIDAFQPLRDETGGITCGDKPGPSRLGYGRHLPNPRRDGINSPLALGG